EVSTGPESSWSQYVPTILFGAFGVIVLWVIVHIVTKDGQAFLATLARKEVARGLITFLVAISTVGIAIILAVSTLVISEGDEGDKRFDRAKQVLTTLIGVLGTIVGFYFGADSVKPEQLPPVNSAAGIITAKLPDGLTGQPYPATI